MHEGHAHHHHHESSEAGKNLALLTYMLDHNRHHAEELHDLAHELTHDGKTAAAELLHEALELFNSGNDKLAAALAAAKEEK